MNFFVQALEDPQLIVDFLSIYRHPSEDIEREVLQLVYYCKLSYIDTKFMSYFIRQFWLEEIKKILEKEAQQKQNSVEL